MKTKFLTSVLLALTLMLAACAPKVAAPTQKAPAPTAKAPAALPTTAPTTAPTIAPTKTVKTSPTTVSNATPTQEAAAATSPTPGPALINDITVDNQSIKTGSVLVSMVDALKPGWVAIFTDKNGQPDVLLGYSAVPEGTSADIKVSINTAKATDKMIAMLLLDAGKVGTFEYPGTDLPVTNANINGDIMAVFSRVSS